MRHEGVSMAGAAGMAVSGGDVGSGPALRAVGESHEDSDARPTRPARSRCDRLSRKERLVLAELARGNSTDEIGIALGVSPHTVRTHVKNLMRKLGARTRAHAGAVALSERGVDLRQ